MTSEERVGALHRRMEHLRHVQERRKTALLGAAGVLIAACLFLLIFMSGMAYTSGSAGMYSGAIMLFENAGGYILAAIAAFMAGVIVTVILIKRKNRKKDIPEDEQEPLK